MNKRARQYLGLILAILSYYLIHEGAHLVYALATGVFKRINFMGFGVQIDVFAERLSNTDLGIFCLVGSIATLIAAYILVFLAKKISSVFSKVFKASMYYITIALLILDPLYLSLLCGFFGGGDMNGISLLIPEIPARILYGIIFAVNLFIFIKIVLPKYKAAFSENDTQEL
jgi:hypothetical protein